MPATPGLLARRVTNPTCSDSIARCDRRDFGWHGHTLALGKALTGTGSDYDYRGVFWYDHVGAGQIFTKCVPNSPVADILYPVWCVTAETSINRAESTVCSGRVRRQRQYRRRPKQPSGRSASGDFVTERCDLLPTDRPGGVASSRFNRRKRDNDRLLICSRNGRWFS